MNKNIHQLLADHRILSIFPIDPQKLSAANSYKA